MRKAEIFVIFTVVLGVINVAFKEFNQRNDPHPFLPWLLLGVFVGFIFSSFWVWRFFPRTSERKFDTRKMSPVGSIFSFSVVIVMMFFGLSLANLSIQMKKATEEVQNWPVIEATIEGQQVYERPPGKSGRIWWAPTWSYNYEIQGKVYHSHSRSAENAYALIPKFHPSEAQADLQQRPVGSKVTAFYNPDSPEISVLDKRADNPTERHLIFVTGMIVLLISGAGAFKIGRMIQSGKFN